MTPKIDTRGPVERRFDEEDEEEDFTASLSTYRQLQESMGSEILPNDLQRQIDESASQPDSFLDKHVADATYMEKVAMSSITEQLPQAAVQAFQNNLSYSKFRVSRDEEIQLARLIQEGARLHSLRQETEAKEGRSLNKQEWADLAGLSAKELRRRVSNYRRAKHDLVSANMGLVHAVVNQLWNGYQKSGVTREELVQEGSLGLLRAAELFDPERGLRFSTYAVVWIKGTLSNTHVPELVRLPAREKTKWNKISHAMKEAEAAGTSPSVEELASLTGLTVDEIVVTKRKMQQAKSVLSLDYEYRSQSRSGADISAAGVTLENDKNCQEDTDLAERTQLQADIIAAMARNLDAREARLMRLRYGLSDGHTRSIAECADAMGLSRTRVQQIAQKCLKKLREAAEAQSLEEYLLTIA